jgi:hypothetical protein
MHTLKRCSETRKWMEHISSRKRLSGNEEAAYKKTNFINAVELRNTGKCMYKINVNGRKNQ